MSPELLIEVLGLKAVARAGWVRRGVAAPESVAAHSWGVGWLVLALLPDDMNRERALAYAVIHDLAEVRVGDLTPYDAVSSEEKQRRERAAIGELLAARQDLAAIWHNYESQADPESQFVRELDRLDMALQAVWYGRRGTASLDEFLDSAERVVQHPALTPILAFLRGNGPDNPG